MEVVETRERPDLEQQAQAAFRQRWPEFIFHDPISNANIDKVGEYFAEWDLLVLRDGQVLAGGWGVPLPWDGTTRDLPDGYDDALVRSVTARESGRPTDTLCIMAAVVAAGAARKGLAGTVLSALRKRALDAGLTRVVCPVRPTLKSSYPLVSMDRSPLGGGPMGCPSTRGSEHTSVLVPTSLELLPNRWSSRAQLPIGRHGRGWSFLRRIATSWRTPLVLSISIARRTQVHMSKRTSGCGIPDSAAATALSTEKWPQPTWSNRPAELRLGHER